MTQTFLISRYEQYARAHGRTDTEQHVHDRAAHPGASAMPFLLWMHAQWRAFQSLSPAHAQLVGEEKQAAFDQWLVARVDAIVVAMDEAYAEVAA